jgi:hypothetical protein
MINSLYMFPAHTQTVPIAVHTVPHDDEQTGAQNMYRLLIIINRKQTVHTVGPVTLI